MHDLDCLDLGPFFLAEDEGSTVYVETAEGLGCGYSRLSELDVDSLYEWLTRWRQKRQAQHG